MGGKDELGNRKMAYQRTITVIVPDGYATTDEFLRDCGLEVPTLAWDHNSNRNYEPVETLAQGIYRHFAYNGPGEKPAWTPCGNGLKQDEARHLARESLRAAGHIPGEKLEDPPQALAHPLQQAPMKEGDEHVE